MDTITVLQVFLGKWKSHTRMAQPSEKFRWKKSMACPCFLHRVFSKAVQPSMKVVVEVYINDFFLAMEYANKMVRQIKEWCFFWSVSLQPTKRNTFPHAVLLRHEGWRATVSCRLDRAIKMELRVVAIKVAFSTDSLKLFRLTLWHYKISQINRYDVCIWY